MAISGVGRNIINTPSQDQLRGKASLFPNLENEEKIMREAIIFFNNPNQEQQNKGRKKDDAIQEFL
jgi:hypothetical protein